MASTSIKEEIRRRMRRQRKLLSAEAQHQAATAIEERLLALEALKAPTTVFCYLSARHELPTKSIIGSLLAAGHTVAVPYSEPDGQMTPKVLRSFADIIDGRFGIPTSSGPPLGGCPTLTMVPALAFDRAGHRVGYGGGYYDRFLSANPKTVSVGLGYDFQLLEALPFEAFDVPLNMVLTPSQLLKTR